MTCVERILEWGILFVFAFWNIQEIIQPPENNQVNVEYFTFIYECGQDALCIVNQIASIAQIWMVVWIWIPYSRLFKSFRIGVIGGLLFHYAMYALFVDTMKGTWRWESSCWCQWRWHGLLVLGFLKCVGCVIQETCKRWIHYPLQQPKHKRHANGT